MGYKIAGEEAVRDAYAAANKPGVAYTVIRPGGLSDGPAVGPGTVHISQGDGTYNHNTERAHSSSKYVVRDLIIGRLFGLAISSYSLQL